MLLPPKKVIKQFALLFSYIFYYLCGMYTKDISISLYIYLSTDRLGSGSAVHLLGYMPYGETLLDLSHTHYETPYQFTGYEKDQETGLHYAGARYYDSRLSTFLSVDRFAEKFPGQSPYCYAGNNPIRYMDVNGDSIWITHNTGFLGLGGKQSLLYENGSLYNKAGAAYTGNIKGFLSKCVNALKTISGTNEGGNMVREMQSSSNNFTIIKTFGGSQFKSSNPIKAYANQTQTDHSKAISYQALQNAGVSLAGGAGGVIYWNPSGAVLPTLNGSGVNSITDLSHEMFHGLDANRGLLDERFYENIKRSEWQAVYRENILRSQLGLPLRTHYKILLDERGNFMRGTGPMMLTPANQPILPNWYTP